MNNNDERDYEEEAANRRAMREEGEQELAAELALQPLDLAPIQARVAAVELVPKLGAPWRDVDLAALREFNAEALTDVPALLAEVRRLREEVERLVGRPAALMRALHESMAQAWRESARLVRGAAADTQTPAGGPPKDMPVAIVEKLADRLDRQGEAAEELAKAVTR